MTGVRGTPSTMERKVLHAQFEDLVKDHQTKVMADYKTAMDDWTAAGSPASAKPIDPRHVISTIDVSGSMGREMPYAIVNGLITTKMSSLGPFFITFHTTPKLVRLVKGDIWDWYQQVMRAEWGGSTNMRAAMKLLIGVMQDVRSRDASFDGKVIHIIHTDGQFNSSFAGFPSQKSGVQSHWGYYQSESDSDTIKSWSTFADEMKTEFTRKGFCFPLTAFWNYRSAARGFEAHGKFPGVKLVGGLSTGILMDILGGKTTFKVDKTGAVVAETDPVVTFLESLARFDLAGSTLYKTGEFVYKDSGVVDSIQQFWVQYAPKSKSTGGGAKAVDSDGK
jgi:hypothetical protein